jgi:hypothetical protein
MRARKVDITPRRCLTRYSTARESQPTRNPRGLNRTPAKFHPLNRSSPTPLPRPRATHVNMTLQIPQPNPRGPGPDAGHNRPAQLSPSVSCDVNSG